MQKVCKKSFKIQIREVFPKVDFSLLDITHSLTIRNECSVESDSRCFSLHCKNMSDQDLFNLIKGYVKQEIVPKLQSNVFFDNSNKGKKTHSIILKCHEPKDFKFRLFPISIPDYCSDDIRKELQDYLWGLSKEENNGRE